MQKKGFTLIELSIVLVIIGLLAGGVLVGQTLLKAAELRNTVNTIVELQTAVATFKLKYNCFPGDCKDATSLFTVAGIVNGDGNGIFNASNDNRLSFFSELNAASLIKNYIYHPPALPIGDYEGINVPINNSILQIYGQDFTWVIDIGNYMVALTSATPDNLGYFGSSLTPSQALYIDQKLDDGLPGAGRVLYTFTTDEAMRYDLTAALTNAVGNSTGATNDGISCMTNDTGTLQYNNLASNEMLCSLAFDINRW